MESNPYFHKDVSYQTLSIPTNEVVQKKIKIITVETITLPQQPNELMNEIIDKITEETTEEITDETTEEITDETTEEPIEEITDEITDKTINKQENNRPDSSPFQINIPYFNIKITSTEILSVAKSVFMQTLLKKISDPVFLMNLMNSEGGKKLLNLAGNFFKDAGTKSENDNDEK
ncbi:MULTISPECIES: hypothetical protein [Bacillus cereus group]|uniref:Uncharacterized protein n=1 Tax=Bacillus thuringiensis subsp. konkukian (strain 97-27) TaxID=281309 RepID=Q6HIA1_BACHK|nr:MULTISPECIES: hypothetical protein [Bacillus cereus group]AAT60000.1 conserved hypothetical protein [[Bacillus thuringiensis] serovar konkukian str. 97-27]AJI31808.1 hypothetical protein BG06_5359 [Bacillus thuringiensis]QKI25057.1 hypothetical protein FOC86_09110 [Bacillus thuringiensis]